MPPDPGARDETLNPDPNKPRRVIRSLPDTELWSRLKAAKGQPVNVYDDSQDRIRTFVRQGRSARPREGERIQLDMRPTPIPPDQLVKAYDEASEFLTSIEADHPILASAIRNQPNMLFLLPEISMMLGSSPMGVDVAASMLDAMPNAVNYASYADTMFQTPVQQMFWQDVVGDWDSSAKDAVTYIFAGLEERGADRVASKAFAWLRDMPVVTQADQNELLMRLWNWGHEEQQTELHDRDPQTGDLGIFGMLDAPQEFVENLVEIPVGGLISWLGSPEEAIRRSGLTLGQQAAYQMGFDPDDGAWQWTSGAVDAVGEVVQDPLNALSGFGAGVKAAKTIPLSAKAIEAGRLAFAGKSILRGAEGALRTRSITARVTYAFKAQTVDALFDGFGATRAGREAFELLQEGNRAKFISRFPQLDTLPDTFYAAAKFTKDPQEMADLMKHIHVADNMLDPEEVNKAKTALDNAVTDMDKMKAQMRLDMLEAKPNRVFVVSDLPSKPNRSFYNFVSTRTAGREGHVANVVRRWSADLTQSVNGEINYFDTRKAVKQTRQLLEHYGVEGNKVDDLLNRFIDLDVGDRQKFMLHDVIEAIGDATGNPLLRFNLVEVYRRAEGVRAYANGLDEGADAAGEVTRKPILPTDMQAVFPFPVNEVDKIIRRYDAAGKLGGALTLGKRGLVGPTQKNRAILVQRLRNMMGKDLPEDLADEDLYQMAYAWLGQGIDPRGWVSKAATWTNNKAINPLDMAFRKAMLGLRPIQWLFKVVLMEEPLRAHVYDMPNMYSKPLAWLNMVVSDHYLTHQQKWAAKNIEWVDSVRTEMLGGIKNVDEAVAKVQEVFGAEVAKTILGKPKSVAQVNRKLGSWMHQASGNLQQAATLPGSTLTRKWRAWNIQQAQGIRNKELLSPSFVPKDDIEDIMHKSIYTLFGDELATSRAGAIPFHWKDTMSSSARLKYGQAWGSKVTQLGRDPSAQWAMRRMVAKANGDDIPAALSAAAFMETPTWKMMKGNIRQFFPDESEFGDLEKTGEVLFRGGEGALGSQRRGTGGRLYFTSDAAVADRFAMAGIPTKSLSEHLGLDTVDDLDPAEVANLFGKASVEISTAVDDGGNLVYRAVSTPEELVDIAKTSGLGPDEIVIRQLRPDRAPSVTRTTVYGKKINLTGVLKEDEMPEGLLEALKADRLVESVKAGSMVRMADGTIARQSKEGGFYLKGWQDHEKRFENTARWMRLNGYGKAVVPDDPNVSGPTSIIALQEFIGKAPGGGDVARIERYFDEKVEAWVEQLLDPVLRNTPNRAEFLEALAERRQFKVELNGHKYDIDLKAQGSARQKLAALVGDQSTFSQTVKFPEEIAAVPFDWRFLDGDDKNLFRRFIDWNIHTFGERATMFFNRRPFWRTQRKKYLDIYRGMGFPDGLAVQLAEEKASKLTNYVMYDISEAPTVIKKLNNAIPFFGATYEVVGTWAYKLPTATGGYWPLGVGGFGRKIDRLMRAFISTGLVKVTEEDGQKHYELQLWREPDTGSPLGNALSKIGYHIRRTPENIIAQMLGVWGEFDPDMALKMSEGGYAFSFGNPLNPRDYGLLSFAQFNAGLSPATNWIINSAAGAFLPAAADQQTSSEEETTLADMADKLDVDADDLARANPGLFDNTDDYRGIFEDTVDPAEIVIPAGTAVTIPGSNLYSSLVEDTFMPFGEIESPAGVIRGLIPAMYGHVLRGLGLVATPSDGAWLDDAGELDSLPLFGLPIDKAAVNSQLLEAFYYLESTEGLFSDKIFPLQQKYEKLVAAGGSAEADEVKAEITRLTDSAIKRATDMAGGAMILRGMGGGFFPNTGRTMREEIAAIDNYWDSKEFAEQRRGHDRDGTPLLPAPLGRMKKPEDIDAFFEQVGNWLGDETGDDARKFIRQNNPEIFAYLQPKTYWGEAGVPPEISNYEDYLEQIRTGKRKPVPLAVAIQRHLRAGLESDYWIDYVNLFGNEPEVAASRALDNYSMYNQLQDERSSARDALDMSDDLHGAEYLQWQENRFKNEGDDYESTEEAIDRQREAYGMLQEMLNLDLDATMTNEEILDHRKIIKTTLARFSEVIDSLEGDETFSSMRNPFELAMNTYWTQIYESYEKAIDPIWDAIGQATDTEEKSLLFENLKLETNNWAQQRYTLFDRTDITYPSPLDIKWQRKTDEEKRAFVLKRSTLPLEWLNLDDVSRIMEFAPSGASFFPTTREDMEVYSAWTVKKNEIDELAEKGLLSETDRRDAQSQAEEMVLSFLRENGRADEATYMSLWPIEQLYVLGLLPEDLEYVMPQVRFIKESLHAEGRGPRSNIGDQLLLPLYNDLMNRAATDTVFGERLRDLGLTLFDESNYDALLPRLIVGDFSDA